MARFRDRASTHGRGDDVLDGYDVIDESTALAPTLDEAKAAFRAVCI